jgi:1-acyl-sn-glycerol-3-phosphate acyltransferase
MAKSELFEMPILGKMIRWFDAFPVKRGEPDRAAMRHAIELLRLGECVCVFPEGQLSETGELQELKPGISLLVRQSGATAICCGLSNTNRIMPYGRMTPRISGHVTPVNWGEPKVFERSSGNEEILAWATEELQRLTRHPQ